MRGQRLPDVTDSPQQDWLTLDEAADAFKVSRRTLERLRSKAALPGVRAGRYLKVREADVRRALTFQNPNLSLQAIIGAPDGMEVKDWLNAWSMYFQLLSDDPDFQNRTRAWIDRTRTEFGSTPVGEFEVGHALRVARWASLQSTLPVFVQVMESLPPTTSFRSVTREFALLFNPHLEADSSD